MNTFTWTLAASAWAVTVGILFLVLLLWLSIRSLRRMDRSASAVALEILRVLVAALLVLTLLKPELVRQSRRTETPTVAILCDASGSMATRDVAVKSASVDSRENWLKRERSARFWAPLEKKYKVALEDFSSPDPTNALDSGTDLNLALDAAASRHQGLRAVFLLSDGDWNLGKSPVTAATRLRLMDVPVYAVGIGSDTYLPDLEIQSVLAPAYGLMDEHISIPFTIQSRLPRDVKTAVTLQSSRGVLARKDVVIRAMTQLHESITLIPTAEEDLDLTLKIPVERDETFEDNNARDFRISLRRELLQVLVADSYPRWEYRYLHNALSRDRGVAVKCFLSHPGMSPGDGTDYIPKFPAGREELSKYDVVFIGDIGIAPGELTSENAEMLKGIVEQQGSGLVFLPGLRGKQSSLLSTPLADLLPVEMDTLRPAGFGFGMESKLALTARGSDHLLTMLASDPTENTAVWKRLPGFFWYAPVVRAKAGTEVLAVHSEARNQHGRIPLLVTRVCGNGKSLFMGTDSAWRWRRGVEDTYHYRFWGQVVRWMAHQRHLAHKEGIRFFFVPETPKRGDTVFLHATVYDKEGFPMKGGSVRVSILSPRGKSEDMMLTPEAGGWGVFTGTFSPREGGKYSLFVKSDEAERDLKVSMDVSSPKVEAVGRPARQNVLQELAVITGGKAGTTRDLDEIVRSIALLPEAKPIEERIRLWCHPAWAALIITLMAGYWTGRKLTGRI